MNLLCFFLGAVVGGLVGVVAMCMFTVSGKESHAERLIKN